jgi:hypothetical protein
MDQNDPRFMEFLLQALRQGTINPDPPMRRQGVPEGRPMLPQGGTLGGAADALQGRQAQLDAILNQQ